MSYVEGIKIGKKIYPFKDSRLEPIEATEDMTQDVGLNMDGRLKTANGGGAETGVLITVYTNAEMYAALTEENVGKAYVFAGTTGTYVNGDIYVVEANENGSI